MFKFIFVSFILLGRCPLWAEGLTKDATASLLSSLTCEQKDVFKILAPIRGLVKQKDKLSDEGIEIDSTGEETDEKFSISLKTPLKLEGATTSEVDMAIDGGEFVIYGEFTGNPAKLIKKLKLKQNDPEIKKDFVNPKPNGECPPTQRLRKTDDTHFRFGCGWCNG